MTNNNNKRNIDSSVRRLAKEATDLANKDDIKMSLRHAFLLQIVNAENTGDEYCLRNIIDGIKSLLYNYQSEEVEDLHEEKEEIEDLQEEKEDLQEDLPEIIYKEPPTFEQAVLDYLHRLCEDLENVPDVPEYNANVEKTIWEACYSDKDDYSATSRNFMKKDNKRKAVSVDTLVKRDMLCVSADCQSGKTKYTVCAAIKGMLKRRTSVLITRRITEDAEQLQRSFMRIVSGLEDYLNRHKATGRRIEFRVIRADNREFACVDNNLMNGIPQIIICLGNESQMQRVKDVVEKRPLSFNLFIDEIDSVDYGDKSKAAEILRDLKGLSFQTTGITATPLDCIFSEEDMKSKNQIRLTPPVDYRGFVDFTVKILTTSPEVYALDKNATYDELCEADANLPVFLRSYSTRRLDNPKKGVLYPNICLIKNTRRVRNQEAMFEGINTNFCGSFVTIVYNGEGVMMGGIVPDNMIIRGQSVMKGVYFNESISNALQWLKDNGGAEVYPRVVIIAGDLAGRCISYVSADYVWHLTDMYYLPAESTPIPEMIQSCGRLCGRNRGKAHLDLHVTKKTADAIYNGFNFTNEVMNRAIATPFYGDDMEEVSFAESVKAVKMNKMKMPKGRKLTTKVKVLQRDWNLTKTARENDGGVSLEDYKYKNPQEEDEGVEEIKENEPIIDAWRRVNRESLSERNKAIYDRMVLAFTDDENGFGLGIEVSKSIVIRSFADAEDVRRLVNNTYDWHSDRNSGNWETVENGVDGLLFKLKGTSWMVMYMCR